MSIIDKQTELFARWRRTPGHEYFISDGIFDEAEWSRQTYKVLYVLKEANWENANVDLCQALLSEQLPTYWKTWNNVARWSKALLEGGEYPRYVSKSDKSYWLRKVAAINLKKAGGDAVAENETIRSHSERDREFLLEQIELYQPDIIICCGKGIGKNADILHDIILPPDQVSDWKPTVEGYDYFLYNSGEGKQVPVVSFYHPQMRGSHELFQKRYEEMLALGAYMKERYYHQGGNT